ncbi:hypothetical protein BJ138DRAFT_1071351 [Hygrophoropsis aurantiaca]|uniref:Uncharacterized protein n=1 Tax=Hygrophoropsis aurantiaca TaxID=72124 RepID=A0ACB7ZZM4_9AGAM|nr:hypothetical protein BJ138DRAFT_1071351 [Hygrophoropsis aurantiaca]
MQHPQVMLAGDPAYGSPVIRPPSPASSVGTAYPDDDTSPSDGELSQDAFNRKWASKLGLDRPKEEEERKKECLLISPKNPAEAKLMHEEILKGFRQQVQQLEEDEMFQQTIMRGSQIGLEPRPSSSNIDSLMRSMMDTTIGKVSAQKQNISDGPWNKVSQSNNSTSRILDNSLINQRGLEQKQR